MMEIDVQAVKRSFDNIIAELERANARIAELEDEVKELGSTISRLDDWNEELRHKNKELAKEVQTLDNALADSYVSELDPNIDYDSND